MQKKLHHVSSWMIQHVKNSGVYSANVIFSDDAISFTLLGKTFELS